MLFMYFFPVSLQNYKMISAISKDCSAAKDSVVGRVTLFRTCGVGYSIMVTTTSYKQGFTASLDQE